MGRVRVSDLIRALTVTSAVGAPTWLLAAVALLAHLYASGGYGYFRDELYFIVCGSSSPSLSARRRRRQPWVPLKDGRG